VSATEPQGQQSPAPIGGLYQQLAPELRAFLLGLLKDHDLADEALHASFTKIIEKQETIRDSNPRAWLFQVAYHEAMAVRRRQGVERRGLQGLAWLKRELESAPETPLIRDETARKIRQSLNTLPAEQRDVVLRRIEHNQTFSDIATELGVPLGTVLTRMRLALQKLQKQLTDLQ
jgi:RNA polymerase sigma factor (sigma-70 family)